jgi:hypothetical protein
MLLPVCGVTSVSAQSKGQIKCSYVIKNLRLNKDQNSKFKPLFMNYVNELKAAKDTYDNLKNKYKPLIKKGKLSEGQAAQLLNAHWNADEKETSVKKKYTSIFILCIGAKKTFEAFDYASDSMKKMKGSNKKSSKEDDEE